MRCCTEALRPLRRLALCPLGTPMVSISTPELALKINKVTVTQMNRGKKDKSYGRDFGGTTLGILFHDLFASMSQEGSVPASDDTMNDDCFEL